MPVNVPRLLVAGLRGGSGKTLVSLGLAASWRKKNLTVAPFKKGPDYIDASWLSLAAGRVCRNLDLFLLSPGTVLRSFAQGAKAADVALVEGNRGLFDGMDAEGSFSSAELAKLLRSPVLLSVDVTKTTRTAAALVLGCQTMDPEVLLGGVVLNRVAGSRHESVLRQSIEGICGIPVVGALPKLPDDLFPERHLGLVPPQETEEVENPLARVAEVVAKYVDLDAILTLAGSARRNGMPDAVAGDPARLASTRVVVEAPADEERSDTRSQGSVEARHGASRARIGVFRDAAFQFYYPENLDALVEAGGELVEISPLKAPDLPPVDALYLGGGFPETLAVGLSTNVSFMESLRAAAESGLPIYAECGGAVYLGRKLHYGGQCFPLVGFLPVEYGFQKRPRGHGYTVLETTGANPFFPVGMNIRAHEFHYTFMLPEGEEELDFAFRVHRGFGFDGQHDGLIRHNVLASYSHVHALGVAEWGPSLVEAGLRHRAEPGIETAS